MSLGPIEVVSIAFPGNRFTGEIIPELERLTSSGTITVIDGVLATRDQDGPVTFVELDEVDGGDGDAGRLAALLDRVEGLVSDEDVEELAGALEPNSSAAILVFEHTWMKPLRDAIFASGGELMADLRVPGPVVEELMATLAES
ncbi:DUF6325 family protein [Nocardioides insulae]|uniref:DUF6325 family protein n=1 Tax=Nocardioides insulae TaxID=394734 RepID=UPI000419B3E9|nr:DUF6325 family protein [Nocardioides insulae]